MKEECRGYVGFMVKAAFYQSNGEEWLLQGHLELVNGQSPVADGDLAWLDYSFEPFSTRLGREVAFSEDSEEWLRALADSYQGDPDVKVEIQTSHLVSEEVRETVPRKDSNAWLGVALIVSMLLIGAVTFFVIKQNDEDKQQRTTQTDTPRTTPTPAPEADPTMEVPQTNAPPEEPTPSENPTQEQDQPALDNLLVSKSRLESFEPFLKSYAAGQNNQLDNTENLALALGKEYPDFVFKTGIASTPTGSKPTVFVESFDENYNVKLKSLGKDGKSTQATLPAV